MKALLIFVFALSITFGIPLAAEEDDHGHEGHGDHAAQGHEAHGDDKEAGVLELSPEQVKQIGLEVETVDLRAKPDVVRAPGVVAFNGYSLADVTTLVDGLILARHTRLGDKVTKGQKLVTLMSTALAQAESDFLRAEAEHRRSKQEWKRLEGLAEQNIVSQARLQQAESEHQANHASLAAARASLASYGLKAREIDALPSHNDYGQLVLYAPSAGTVVVDDFRLGQHISAGTRLLQIADEKSVWAEVKIPASQLASVGIEQPASVRAKGSEHYYNGKVVNIHHQLDQITRTAGVRLEIQNPEDALHPGMFVDAEIDVGTGENALLLREQAVQRQGSELIVFVEEEPGHFERREVRVGKASMGYVPVLEGLKEGERVVVKGAFALASELAKSGFEVHQH